MLATLLIFIFISFIGVGLPDSVLGTVFGLADEWMRRGMQETPEQIIALTGYMNNSK